MRPVLGPQPRGRFVLCRRARLLAWHRSSYSRFASAIHTHGESVRARYVATLAELKSRYREWEIIGPPEIRVDAPVQMFQPDLPRLGAGRSSDPPLELQPQLATPVRIDATERFLLRVFLRRYVTDCARRGRFKQMQGAARLFAQC